VQHKLIRVVLEVGPKFACYCEQELGLAVVGSQIVGLVPLKAML